MPPNPFVIGQWVRGPRFYGRRGQIEEILDGPRNWIWLLGTRRIGKTSFLKQIEHLAASEPRPRYFPIFWDFQGADDPEELHRSFGEAILDAEERLAALEIGEAEVEGKDLFDSIGRLRRQLRSRDLNLLLLCDEVEELITLNRADPSILRKLRRALQSSEDVRSVLASTIRLWALSDQRGDTSPFLHGFAPPVHIRGLGDESARALIRQEHLPPERRPGFDEESVERIRTLCDNHPYLIQLVAKRFLEAGDLDLAVEAVAADQMVSYFFAVDFEMLSPAERDVLLVIGEASAASSDSLLSKMSIEPSDLSGSLLRLENLGYIRRGEGGRFTLVNYFFRRWFREQPHPAVPAAGSGVGSGAAPALADSPTLIDEPSEALLDNRYRLLEEIGRGAMGVVFRARDQELDEIIAIKILKPQYCASEGVISRFRREILIGRDITHENILRLYHLGEHQGQKFLAMKLVDGETLADVIRREGKMPLDRIVEIGCKMASALEAAHAEKVVHRDIKPQNILIAEDGEPYLTDFGLARLLDSPGTTQEGVFLGTPHYASPEQAKFLPTDERSDLYSLGLILFEMATGQRPFRGGSSEEILEMHRSAGVPDPVELRPEIPLPLARVILCCLQKIPSGRYQTAAALRAALEELQLRNLRG